MPPTRILQVVHSLNVGGIETWLVHVLRHMDRRSLQMDFMTQVTSPCAYDDEVRSLGAAIIPGPNPSVAPLAFAKAFHRTVRERGPYDVVHSHLLEVTGYVLRQACRAGIPVRVSHTHNSGLDARKRRWITRAVKWIGRRWIRRYMTVGIGASREACAFFFGRDWQEDPRIRVVHCGVDLRPFEAPVSREEVRQELGLPQDAYVVGHVGRFYRQKNHALILDIARELARQGEGVHFLLVGAGPLFGEIESRAKAEGLTDRVHFCGVQRDVARILLGAVDVFLFPSLYEGLGLALVEAQAAGLPCILSDVVPGEADVVEPLIHRLSLEQPPSAWAEALLDARDRGPRVSRAEALDAMVKSSFNISTCVRDLAAVYQGDEVGP